MNYEEIIEKIEDILEEGKPSFGGGGKIKEKSLLKEEKFFRLLRKLQAKSSAMHRQRLMQ